MTDIEASIQNCVPAHYQRDMRAIVQVESSGNPYAIAIIKNGRMAAQPMNEEQAKKTLDLLNSIGIKYAAGGAQINKINFSAQNLHRENVFDSCNNLKAGYKILEDCHIRAQKVFPSPDYAKQAAYSCYYSGNFKEGFEKKGHSYTYVEKVMRQLGKGGALTSKEAKEATKQTKDYQIGFDDQNQPVVLTSIESGMKKVTRTKPITTRERDSENSNVFE